MRTKSYFITVDYLKKYYSGYLDQYVDPDSLNTFILLAESQRVQSVLGHDLYFKYINDIDAYGAPQGSQYLFLMDNYIQDSASLWSIYYALEPLQNKITNKGIVNKTSQYSTGVSDTSINRKLNGLMKNAEFADARVLEYITNNYVSFPEYNTATGINRIRHKNSMYFSGMYMPRGIKIKGGYGRVRRDDGCCGGYNYGV